MSHAERKRGSPAPRAAGQQRLAAVRGPQRAGNSVGSQLQTHSLPVLMLPSSAALAGEIPEEAGAKSPPDSASGGSGGAEGALEIE